MEPLFYNRRIMTPQHARELFRHSFMQYHVSYAILFLVYLGLFIYVKDSFPTNIITIILIFTIIAMYIYRPYSYAKKRIKEYTVLHNATEEDEAFFYKDFLITKDVNNNAELKIEYRNIKKMKTTKNLYIFYICNSKTRMIIDKHIIQKGTEPDFEKFMKSKICK